MGEAAKRWIFAAKSLSAADHASLEIEHVHPQHRLKPETEEHTARKARKVAHCDAGAMRTIVLRDVWELEKFTSDWLALASEAVDSNVYYEPWWLLPSLRYLYSGRETFFVLMFARDPDCPTGPEILCGISPFQLETHYRGIPCRVLRLLRPTYNRLCTPLVRTGFVTECVRALLDWTEHNSASAPLIEFRFITGEGRVAQELHQQVSERRWMLFQSDCTIRALFKPLPNAQLYLERALRGKHRKELRRLEKRLSEAGPTEYRCLEQRADAAPWIASFLELESRGWKGQGGSSLASRDETRRFFEEAALEAHRQGRLMMLGLFHREKPIALKCNLLSGNGSVAFKIAFDEDYARYSPGMLLEMENVRRLHEMPEVEWMDSTADAQHFMINRLWMDRRTIETLVVSPNRAWGNLIVSGFPFLRWVKGATQHMVESMNFRKTVERTN